MPVFRAKFVTREDLRAHPFCLFLFGDNEARRGMGGQAREMRGEPNAHGVRTKRAPDNRPGSFWSDDDLAENCRKLNEDFRKAIGHLEAGGVVAIPEDGLGTGLADLPRRAPATFAYLNERIRLLESCYGTTNTLP